MDKETLREARRQKILNNMNNRMMKITGAASTLGIATDSTNFSNIPNSTDLNNYSRPHEPANHQSSQSSSDVVDDTQSEETIKLFHQKRPPNQEVPKLKNGVSYPRFLSHNYFHTIVLALCSYNLLLSPYGYLIYNNAMVPFYTLAAIDYVVRKKDDNAGMVYAMVVTFLEMYGLPNRYLTQATKIYHSLMKLVTSLVIYLFFIIIFTTTFGV